MGWTSYTYQGANILREVRGATVFTYVHGPRVDEAIGAEAETGPSYFHADGLGSIAGRTNAAGTVTVVRRYQAWGHLEAGASEAGYAFTGGMESRGGSLLLPLKVLLARNRPFHRRRSDSLQSWQQLLHLRFGSPAGRVDPFDLSDCCPEQKCPSGVWYGGGSGGAGWGTYSGPSGSFSVVRVTCWGKPALTADVAFGRGGQGVAFVPRPLQAYMGISIDGVVCTAACKSDLLGTSKGGQARSLWASASTCR